MNRSPRAGLLKPRERSLPNKGAVEHIVVAGGQFFCEGALDFQAQIAPTTGNPVSFVFSGDIEAPNDGQFLIANEQFAMVANSKSAKQRGIETAGSTAGGDQWIEKCVRQSSGTQCVEQHSNAHASATSLNQCIADSLSEIIGGVNVGFESNGSFGPGNGLQ